MKKRAFQSWRPEALAHDDGLGKAVWTGNVALVQRFLPAALDATPRYQDNLMMLALYKGNPEVIQMIGEKLPEIRQVRWKADKDVGRDATLRDEDLRLFLPRTAPLGTEAECQRGRTCARGNFLTRGRRSRSRLVRRRIPNERMEGGGSRTGRVRTGGGGVLPALGSTASTGSQILVIV